MWVSSFARDSNPLATASSASSTSHAHSSTATLCVRAHVWGSNNDDAIAPVATADAPLPVETLPVKRVVLSPDDALTLAMTADINVLRQLKLVNGSFVCVRRLASDAQPHIAKLVLVDATTAYSSTNDKEATAASDANATVVGDITLSPLLAFNLGVPLCTTTTDHVTALLSIRAATLTELGLESPSTATTFRRSHQQQPAVATYATIASLLVSSVASRDHALLRSTQHRDGLLDAIRACFATAQVLQVGDTFAVALHETTASHDASDAPKYEAYTPVTIPASFYATSDAMASTATTVLLPPALPIDTMLMFFRVEKLDGDATGALARSVSAATELLQTRTVASAAAPDSAIVQRFLAFCAASSSVSSSQGSLNKLLSPAVAPRFVPPKALTQLYEMLYPSQVCDVPVSVLLSGARGTGKATLVRLVAQQLGVNVVEVAFTTLTASSELQMFENVREQITKALALSPCVLYIRRFFALDKDNDEIALRFSAVLAECLQRLSQRSDAKTAQTQRSIPLLACVEDVSDVPKFIRQRFLYELAVESPDLAMRHAILDRASQTAVFSGDVDVQHLAQVTAGRTCGELEALVADAGAIAVERLVADVASDKHASTSLLDHLAGALDKDGDASLPLDVAIHAADLTAALKQQQALAAASKVGTATIPNVKWDDVGGLEDVKNEILDVVQLPLQHPELFASGIRQRSGILLYGPPGTGKTLLAKAIATECQLNFLSVKGPELLNMYIGESEKNVRLAFAKARSCRPCVLFFDELDSLAPMRGRGSDSGGVMDRVVSQLLTEIDGLSGGGNDQVFVIGATNRPDLLETGLLRPGRFDRLLYLGICNEKTAQRHIVDALTRKFQLADDVDLDVVVEQCPLNFTGADFYALCSGALAAALKDRVAAIDAEVEAINAADCYSSTPMTVRMLLSRLPPHELHVRVAQAHFLAALATVVPSVSPAELAHYERLKEQYSSKQDK